MARMHELASASPPYERVPNILKLRYTVNNLFNQLPPILIALQPIDLIKLFSIRSIHLYQVNVTLHFYE